VTLVASFVITIAGLLNVLKVNLLGELLHPPLLQAKEIISYSVSSDKPVAL
jgi:hypothetical protein